MLQAFPKACEVNKTTCEKRKGALLRFGKNLSHPGLSLSLCLLIQAQLFTCSLVGFLAQCPHLVNGPKEISATCTEANFYLVIHVTLVDHSFNMITILDFKSIFVLWPISPADLLLLLIYGSVKQFKVLLTYACAKISSASGLCTCKFIHVYARC